MQLKKLKYLTKLKQSKSRKTHMKNPVSLFLKPELMISQTDLQIWAHHCILHGKKADMLNRLNLKQKQALIQLMMEMAAKLVTK